MTESVTWRSETVRTAGHEIPVRIYRPGVAAGTAIAAVTATRAGRLVWAHGGSWRSGSVADWHPALADLARCTGATVIGVDYRLAPDHPHPAPLRDLLAVLAWVDEQVDEQAGLRTGGGPVAVGGDSAGATLAASAALVRRDLGLPLAAQLLAYPPIDPACAGGSYRRDPQAFPDRDALQAAWRDYRGTDAPGTNASGTDAPASDPAVGTPLYSTPAEARDLTGVAPAVLAVGALDPVADDVLGYAEALIGAEVPVEYVESPGIRHGAFLASAAFRRRLAAAYRAVLAARDTEGASR